MATNAMFLYVYTQNNFDTTQDRGEVSTRTDWNMGASPWTFWASGRGEMDNLAPWDYRVSAATGLGYNFIKNNKMILTGRLGVGGSREFNGENALIPEVGILGFSLDYKLSERSTLNATTEYYPSGRHWDWDDYRAVSRAKLVYTVDPELKMTLQVGVEHRFDSEVASDRTNAVDYFVTLGFAF